MITQTDRFVILELFERLENDELDYDTAKSKLDDYIAYQKSDFKNNKGKDYNE